MPIKSRISDYLKAFGRVIFRRKKVIPEKSKLKQCLNVVDLTSLGIGSCWGAGLYVIVGHVAKKQAGPASFLSFLFAAFTSFFSGICYGEFGERVPRTTGSAYMYSYVTIGELVAFVTGWNLLLEYFVGLAVNSVALSDGIDAMTGQAISQFLTNHTFPVIGRSYPDFLALILGMLVTMLVACGVQVSVTVTNIMNAVNVGVVVFFVVVGSFYADVSNWDNFAPYGAQGVLRGTATSFFAFIGFDVIATMGEETTNPSKTIPRSIILCLVLSLMAYVSVSVVLTLMIPYTTISDHSALIAVFQSRNMIIARYIVIVGSITALSVDLLSAVFPVPRIIYAMSRDGLFFSPFAVINQWTKTPFRATLAVGIFSSLLATFVGLGPLVEMMSIGTLFAYTIVSTSVLVLRYRPHLEDQLPPSFILNAVETPGDDEEYYELPDSNHIGNTQTNNVNVETNHLSKDKTMTYGAVGDSSAQLPMTSTHKTVTSDSNEADGMLTNADGNLLSTQGQKLTIWKRLFAPPKIATKDTSLVVQIFVFYLMMVFLAIAGLLTFQVESMYYGNAGTIIGLVILVILAGIGLTVIAKQPQSRHRLNFKVPGLPFFPCVGIFLNIYLMMKLSSVTIIRLVVWLAIGFVLYFAYGIKHAGMARAADQEFAVENMDDGSDVTEFSAYMDDQEEINSHSNPG